jgi:hypothetical protein
MWREYCGGRGDSSSWVREDAMGALVFVLILLCVPVVWQIPRTFWRVHLNASGSAFTGLYRRYSVTTVTGYASGVSTWSGSQTVGNVTGSTSGTLSGSYFSGTTTVHDNRRTFVTTHTGFFLTDSTGVTHPVDAANVDPSIGEGHLVSAAWLVHNSKPGNAFFVYNHTTDTVYVEDSRRGLRNPKRGLVKMVFKLPLAWQVILLLGIVTIPLVAILALGAHWQVKWFRKRGIKPLVVSLRKRAAEMPPALSAAAGIQSSVAVRDLASQMREITEMHQSGTLTIDEFQAAKAKLLET